MTSLKLTFVVVNFLFGHANICKSAEKTTGYSSNTSSTESGYQGPACNHWADTRDQQRGCCTQHATHDPTTNRSNVFIDPPFIIAVILSAATVILSVAKDLFSLFFRLDFCLIRDYTTFFCFMIALRRDPQRSLRSAFQFLRVRGVGNSPNCIYNFLCGRQSGFQRVRCG